MDAVLQFLRLIIIILFIVLMIAGGAVLGIIAADMIFGPRAANFSNISYEGADGAELVAYINAPPGSRRHPAVIMVPDFYGLSDEMIRLANHIAREGYLVIVPDLYRGASANAFPRALLLSRLTPAARILSDLNSTFAYLMAHERVNTRHIGIVGFGFGGGAALRYAVDNPNLTAIVNAYGAVITGPEALAQLGGPVLGTFGSQDWLIRPAQVSQFRAALEAAGIEHTIFIHPQPGGYLKFPDITVTGSDPHVAWTEILAFLDAHLTPRPSLPVERRGF
jgi:carboxymethylenebutenolidase